MVPDTSSLVAPLRRIRHNLERCVAIDTRTLAAFRVVAGLLILADVILRSRNFWFFYTDEGVVPRSHAQAVTADNAFSFFHLTTDPTLIGLLMVVHVLVAIQLIVGYKTRLATILSFLFVISLDYHNPFITSYADVLFRLLLFWAIFLPLGERFSIDAVHRDRASRPEIASVASAFILGQMVYMYFLNGFHKTESELWTTGEAAPLVLGRDDITFLFGEVAREFPTLLTAGGLIWFIIMLTSPLLILLVGRLRLLLMTFYVGGHLSFALTVRIGAFAYVALAGLLLFVQSPIWRDAKTILDRVGVDYRAGYARLRNLERIAHATPRLELPGETQLQVRRQLYTLSIVTIVVVVLLFSVGPYLPLGPITDENAPHKQQIEETANGYMIDQPDWTVFAPNPGTNDRYHVFAARTTDGEFLDVYNDRPLTFDRPHDELQKQYGTYRERFYMNSVRSAGDHSNTPVLLGEHICETYEEEYGIELDTMKMYSVSETITLETLDTPEERDNSTFYHHSYACGDEEPEEFDLPEDLGDRAP